MRALGVLGVQEELFGVQCSGESMNEELREKSRKPKTARFHEKFRA
jgi:hypothetical protein